MYNTLSIMIRYTLSQIVFFFLFQIFISLLILKNHDKSERIALGKLLAWSCPYVKLVQGKRAKRLRDSLLTIELN